MTEQIDSTKSALVAPDFFWRPIDKDTPLGVKLLVANRANGVATISNLGGTEHYFTHYAPLPKFLPEPLTETNTNEPI